MATKEDIITLPNDILRKVSKKVKKVDKEITDLIGSMTAVSLDWEASRDFEVCVGLAAVQIGVLKKVTIIRQGEHRDKGFEVLINPRVIKTYGDPIPDFEGCLSVKDIYGIVPRYQKVKIQALDETGKPFRRIYEGFDAVLAQHESDHTKGVLFVDHIKGEKEAFHAINDEGKIEKIDYEQILSAGIFR